MDVTTSSIQTLSFFHEAFQTFHINRTTIESLILSSQIPRNLRKKYIYTIKRKCIENSFQMYPRKAKNLQSKYLQKRKKFSRIRIPTLSMKLGKSRINNEGKGKFEKRRSTADRHFGLHRTESTPNG